MENQEQMRRECGMKREPRKNAPAGERIPLSPSILLEFICPRLLSANTCVIMQVCLVKLRRIFMLVIPRICVSLIDLGGK